MVRIIGHRGAAGVTPENTITSFEAAISAAVAMIEFDVRQAADGLVVIHDNTVDRTTDGTGRVADHTLTELQQLDAGNGAHVPSLDDAFAFFAEHETDILVELKETGIAGAAEELMRKHGLLDCAVVISFHADALQELSPNVQTGLLGEATEEYLEQALQLGCEYASVGYEQADAAAITRFRENGMRPILFTPNTEDALRAAIGLEPYAVTTDYPRRAQRVKKQVLEPIETQEAR